MPNQLTSSPLQAELIKTAVVKGCALDMDVQVLASIDSTNSWSLQQCKHGKKLPFACFAEEQTRGRGRRGRRWQMKPFSNIAMSLAWRFDFSSRNLSLLPLSVAVAIVQSLESFGLKQVKIKWPNDIYVCGKKIAGILIETRPLKADHMKPATADYGQIAVVIGIGLNYDMTPGLQGGLQGGMNITDICEQVRIQGVNHWPDRSEVAARLLQHLLEVCRQFQLQADHYLAVFRERYDYCCQKNVEIMLDNEETLFGVALGVTDEAELLVSIDGEERVFHSADVSVRAESA